MKYVKIKSVNPCENDSVYHLTVDNHHNFFANKLCVHNCDYRGHVMVILINHGKNDFKIENGDRIAQGVFSAVSSKNYLKMTKVESLSDTKRGSGGLGSTGVK
jgi:dUTP pyrophosphatase